MSFLAAFSNTRVLPCPTRRRNKMAIGLVSVNTLAGVFTGLLHYYCMYYCRPRGYSKRNQSRADAWALLEGRLTSRTSHALRGLILFEPQRDSVDAMVAVVPLFLGHHVYDRGGQKSTRFRQGWATHRAHPLMISPPMPPLMFVLFSRWKPKRNTCHRPAATGKSKNIVANLAGTSPRRYQESNPFGVYRGGVLSRLCADHSVAYPTQCGLHWCEVRPSGSVSRVFTARD